ncbi:RNA-protein complex protein Nop10 [archaeon]|nr:RNA-protein complex protein Nop10 [archaeon]
MLKCEKCNEYTLKEKCSKCDSKTINPKPAKYSETDRMSKYRNIARKAQ